MAAKQPYTVLSPVDHDNSRHEIGETIELGEKDAATLLQLGVVAKVEPSDAEGEGNGKGKKK